MASNNGVHFLVTVHLISHGTKQTGAILFHLLNDEPLPANAFLEPPVSLQSET
jgi:hypothetical protein